MRNTIGSVAAAAFIGTAAAGASAQQGQAVQWRVEDGGNGHWYGTAEAIDWETAKIAASARGAHLATSTSAHENTLIEQVFLATGRARGWIGLEQADDQATPDLGWRWVTGERLAWTNWHCFTGDLGCAPDDTPCFQQPWRVEDNEANCATMQGDGKWDDLEKAQWCDGQSRIALLEWSADCNNDGIVDYGQCRDGSLPDYNGNNIPDCCETGTPCEVGTYPVQWRIEDGGNGHWYLANRWYSPKTWEDARSSAEQIGGYLACVTSAAENQFIYDRSNLYQPGCTNSQEGWHLGGYQDLSAPDYSEPAGGWRWISGEPWSYTAWLTGVPGGDRPNNFGPGGEQYLKMSEMRYAPRWDDVGVGSSQLLMCGAIIEWSADCNNDGIVDYGQILAGQLTDSNADGVPDICQCPGDITGNGAVDGVDLAIVLGAWGTGGQGEFESDIDRDGVVSGTDLAYVLGGWGPCQ